MKTEIGIATLITDEDNDVISATFKPTMELKDCDKLVKLLKEMDSPLEEKAQSVFSSWFNKMNEIEMADREQYRIVTTNQGTQHIPNSSNFSTSFLFTFEKV